MKILYLYPGASSPVTILEKKLVANINSDRKNPFEIKFWDWTTEYNFLANPSIDWSLSNKDYLLDFYKKLLLTSKEYDVTLISQTGGIIPEVMNEIKSYVIFSTADDPNASEKCSFPFLKSADLIVHAGVNYNATTRMGVEFKNRGAKRTYFMPIGFYEEMFPLIKNFDQMFYKRDIPLIYVGRPKRGRIEKFARNFGKKLRIYNRKLDLKNKVYFWIFTGRHWILPFTGKLHELYQRCQIGINIHESPFGPSNVRCYQLNCAGVAQIMDCPEGNHKIYVPSKEILSYSSQDEAISKTKLLLKDEKLRYNISKRGYDRARSCYNRKDLLIALFNKI